MRGAVSNWIRDMLGFVVSGLGMSRTYDVPPVVNELVLGASLTGVYDEEKRKLHLEASGSVQHGELGNYYFGVGAAGLNSISGFESGGPQTSLGYFAIVDASDQKFYTVFPSSWGQAFVTLDGFPVDMLSPRSIDVSGVTCTLLESSSSATGTDLEFYVSGSPGVGGTGSGAGGRVTRVLFVDPVVADAGANGELGNPFATPQAAVTWAVANGLTSFVVSCSPGNHSGAITIPSSVTRIVFASTSRTFATGADSWARIIGNVLTYAPVGVYTKEIEMNGVTLSGNITTADTSDDALSITMVDSEMSGSIECGTLSLTTHRSRRIGAITAHASGTGQIQISTDQYSFNYASLNSFPGNVSPAPVVTILDTDTSTASSSVTVNHVLLVDGIYGTAGGDGSLGRPFQTITQAMNWAVAHSIYRPIIALAFGTYTGEIAVPEELRGIVLSEFVSGALESNSTSCVRIVGDISCTSYQGISRVDLNRIFLTGNIISRNPSAAPAQLNLCVRDCQIAGNLTASQIVVTGHRTKFVSSTIAASSGYVALDLDRFTRKGMIDSGSSVTVTPAPTITILDGPLTVAEGGDPGAATGTVASDAIQQIFNFEDGRRVWRYERMYCVTLENGVENSGIVITESEHGGDGAAVWNPGTDFSHPIAHIRVEFFGSLPSTLTSATMAGFVRMTWEGAIDKDGFSGVWAKREDLSMVQPSWVSPDNLGHVTAGLLLSGTANRNTTVRLCFDGPQDPPPYSLVKVTIHGTGKFQL